MTLFPGLYLVFGRSQIAEISLWDIEQFQIV